MFQLNVIHNEDSGLSLEEEEEAEEAGEAYDPNRGGGFI